MLKTGLVSISFRNLSPATIIEMTARGGLDAIEWGGDIHVPHGDTVNARHVKELCRRNSIECPSYGSYYKVGEYIDPKLEFLKVLDCAKILESEIIRVWAGILSTKDSDEGHFNLISGELKEICKLAAEKNMGIGLEFHANTLTDNAVDTLRLIKSVDERNLTTYWQPPVGRSVNENLSDIDILKNNISNIHTFSWKGRQRLALMKGYSDWVKYLGKLIDEKDRYCMLEFIKDDSVEGFFKDSITLRTLVNLF